MNKFGGMMITNDDLFQFSGKQTTKKPRKKTTKKKPSTKQSSGTVEDVVKVYAVTRIFGML